MNLIHIINYTLNLIYPNVCGICDKINKEDICNKCKIKLNRIAKVKIDIYKKKYFNKHLYIFKYEGIIKERLINFKFNEKTYIYRSFINFITNNKKICRFLKSYDIIIPVPIHYKRRLKRGYNQSELIAKEVAKNVHGIIYNKNILFKKINNKPQSSKNRNDRKLNVIGAYYIKNSDKLKGKRIILLDDIYTTGSTVNECSKLLKENGAKIVDVITIAKD